MTKMQNLMKECVEEAQKNICNAITKINQKSNTSHPWKATTMQGGGVANIFKGGAFLEKGGVSVSTIKGKVFSEMAKMLKVDPSIDISNATYFATGVSLVLHPHSPFIPTVHANYRYFEIENENRECLSWFFGGGQDLTPYYLFEEDAAHFHMTLQKASDKTEEGLYNKLKKAADEYFYLPHRKEHRGIGGIFALKLQDRSQDRFYEWAKSCSSSIIASYMPIVERRMHQSFTEQNKRWQLIRRGRYVEFNLMYDVGTLFGLKSGGETENILMSLPPEVSWDYRFEPKPGSEEEKLLNVIKKPREWV